MQSHPLEGKQAVETLVKLPVTLLQKWDALSRAIGAIQIAQPAEMTAASTRLAESKQAFEAELEAMLSPLPQHEKAAGRFTTEAMECSDCSATHAPRQNTLCAN